MMRTIPLLALLLCAVPASGEITVEPANPLATDAVVITLRNSYSSNAGIESASITRVGNIFHIQQQVALGCIAPHAPTLTSQFNVGALPPGAYHVQATITYRGVAPPPFPCSRAPETQTASFLVGPLSEIPTLDAAVLFLLAATLAVIALQLTRSS